MSFHSFGHCYFSMYTGLWRTALLQLILFLILYTFQYLFSVLLDIFLIVWVCFILHDTLHIKRWGYYSKSSDFNNTTYSFCLFTYLLIYLLKMCLHLSNQTICSYLHKFCSFCLFFLRKPIVIYPSVVTIGPEIYKNHFFANFSIVRNPK